tara:strand:+ start:800 stop:1264 length:465 start_codon:yes stop_codon:yes gene_type:complete
MPKSKRFISNNLNEEEKRTLLTVLNLIIPASENGKMPSANDVGFFTFMENENIESFIQEVLIMIIDASNNNYNQEFSMLSADIQLRLIDRLRRKHVRLFTSLINHVFQCYYQNDDVLEGIGMEARPPFPKGYFVEEGDILLLESVFERGKIYRD